jgi:exodeoxyribonuclease VII small subunit
MSYESELSRLDAIVAELEGKDLELEQALALFQEGVECLRAATKALSKLEGQVQILVERDDGTYALKDLGG